MFKLVTLPEPLIEFIAPNTISLFSFINWANDLVSIALILIVVGRIKSAKSDKGTMASFCPFSDIAASVGCLVIIAELFIPARFTIPPCWNPTILLRNPKIPPLDFCGGPVIPLVGALPVPLNNLPSRPKRPPLELAIAVLLPLAPKNKPKNSDVALSAINFVNDLSIDWNKLANASFKFVIFPVIVLKKKSSNPLDILLAIFIPNCVILSLVLLKSSTHLFKPLLKVSGGITFLANHRLSLRTSACSLAGKDSKTSKIGLISLSLAANNWIGSCKVKALLSVNLLSSSMFCLAIAILLLSDFKPLLSRNASSCVTTWSFLSFTKSNLKSLLLNSKEFIKLSLAPIAFAFCNCLLKKKTPFSIRGIPTANSFWISPAFVTKSFAAIVKDFTFLNANSNGVGVVPPTPNKASARPFASFILSLRNFWKLSIKVRVFFWFFSLKSSISSSLSRIPAWVPVGTPLIVGSFSFENNRPPEIKLAVFWIALLTDWAKASGAWFGSVTPVASIIKSRNFFCLVLLDFSICSARLFISVSSSLPKSFNVSSNIVLIAFNPLSSLSGTTTSKNSLIFPIRSLSSNTLTNAKKGIKIAIAILFPISFIAALAWSILSLKSVIFLDEFLRFSVPTLRASFKNACLFSKSVKEPAVVPILLA